jgi:hypothetical protein
MASHIEHEKFLATLGARRPSTGLKPAFISIAGPNAAAPTSMKRRFPRGSESRSLVDGDLF